MTVVSTAPPIKTPKRTPGANRHDEKDHRGNVSRQQVYVVENATLDWSCDLVENSALSGPAM